MFSLSLTGRRYARAAMWGNSVRDSRRAQEAAILAFAIAVALGVWSDSGLTQRALSWLAHQRIELPRGVLTHRAIDVIEPSGIAYHPGRGTFLVASDEGQLCEVDTDFRLLRRFDLPGDLEGVAVHPSTGTVFVASEVIGTIYEFDLDLGRPIRELVVDYATHADFANKRPGNRGVEGVAVVPSGGGYDLYAVVEASPPRLIRLKADLSDAATLNARRRSYDSPVIQHVAIVESIDVGVFRLSGVTFDASTGELLLVSSRGRLLTRVDLNGVIRSRMRLLGRRPEGICIAPDGSWIVTHDTGGLSVIQWPGNQDTLPKRRRSQFPRRAVSDTDHRPM